MKLIDVLKTSMDDEDILLTVRCMEENKDIIEEKDIREVATKIDGTPNIKFFKNGQVNSPLRSFISTHNGDKKSYEALLELYRKVEADEDWYNSVKYNLRRVINQIYSSLY